MDERSRRIARYESLFDECSAAVDALASALRHFAGVSGKFSQLETYYGSGEWQSDFEADEAGFLPKELKRGVLSEDGVHDLLAEYDELMMEMREIAGNGHG